MNNDDLIRWNQQRDAFKQALLCSPTVQAALEKGTGRTLDVYCIYDEIYVTLNGPARIELSKDVKGREVKHTVFEHSLTDDEFERFVAVAREVARSLKIEGKVLVRRDVLFSRLSGTSAVRRIPSE